MALTNIIRHIVLDVSVHKYVAVVIKQNDRNSRELIVTVTDCGRPYPIDISIKPRIKCKKNDNTFVVNDCTVLDNGTIKIYITDQMTIASGISDYELVLFDANSDSILHTMNFVINVKKNVFSDEEISSTNEFTSFDNALLSVDKMEIAVDKMKTEVAEMQTIVDEVETTVGNLETKVDTVEKNISEIQQVIDGDTFVCSNQKGNPNGVATLNESGFVPSNQLPAYVDDVLDGIYDEANEQFLDLDGNAYTPESGKIYIDVDTRITYRWSGTLYVEIASSLALGITDETAFQGSRGYALEQLIGEGFTAITEAEIDELFA